MKLRLPNKLQAALVAALASVSFTTLSTGTIAVATGAAIASQQAQADTITTTTNWVINRNSTTVAGTDLDLIISGCSQSMMNAGSVNSSNVFAPNVNVGNASGTWVLTFSIENHSDHDVTLNSLSLDISMFNSSGNAQNTSTNRSVMFTMKQNDSTLGVVDTVTQGRGDVTKPSFIFDTTAGRVTDQKPTLTFGEDGLKIAANTEYTYTLTAAQGSNVANRNGCYFGLLGMEGTYSYEVAGLPTWNGTEGNSAWSSESAWLNGIPTSSTPVVFNDNAASHTVNIDTAATAGAVTVSGQNYTFNLADGGSLTASSLTVTSDSLSLTGAGNVTAGSISASDKTINIGKDVVLQGGSTAAATLAGTGTYVLASGTKTLGSISLGSDWTGYVRLSGVSFSNDNIDSLARNGDAGVEMAGITGGYAANWNGGTVHADIRLTNPNGTNDNIAWKWSDGTTADKENNYPTVTFDGTWDGSGTFRLTEKRQCVTFSGNISGWDGAFDYRGQHGTKLTFTGNATTVNAAILNNGTNDASKAWKQFHLIVDNNATFNKAVGAYTLDITANHTATFGGTTNIANGVTLNSGSTLVNTGTMTLDGTIVFGENAIQNSGTVNFGSNIHFDITNLAFTELEGVTTYTLFSGNAVDLHGFNTTHITVAGGTAGKEWTFGEDGTISFQLSRSVDWNNGAGTGKWNYTDANWSEGRQFQPSMVANFFTNADATVSESVVAGAIVVGQADADAPTVAISAEGGSTLTAGALDVVKGTLTTNTAILGLESVNIASGTTWNINADQTLGAGTYAGVISVGAGHTVTLNDAGNASSLLTGITGAGNVTLATNATINNSTGTQAAPVETHATGTLTIAAGKTLTISGSNTKYADIDSFSAVVMESGASINSQNYTYTINNLTVNGNTITLSDTGSINNTALHLAGTTTLTGNLKLASGWKYKVEIDKLTGSGNLELTGGSQAHQVYIHQDSTAGTITMGNGMDGSSDGKNSLLALEAGMTLSGDLSLKRGTTEVYGTTTVGGVLDLSLNGDSNATLNIKGGGTVTLENTNNASFWGDDGSHLNLEEGGTLALDKYGLSITGLAGGGSVTFPSNTQYGIDKDGITITGANVTVTAAGTGAVTIGNKLTNSKLTTGSHAVTLSHAEDSLVGLTISNGGSFTLNNTNLVDIANVQIENGGTLVLGAANLLGDSYTVTEGATVDLGDYRHTMTTLTLNGGTATTTHHAADGCISGTIAINAGGTFKVLGQNDAFGYNSGVCTTKIVMQGEDSNLATLALNQNTDSSVTMRTNIEMNGYSAITTTRSGFNTWGGGSITVTGIENTIEKFQIRNNATINVVGAADTLSVGTMALGADSGKELTKTGAGTLTFTESAAANKLTISEGTVVMEGNATLEGLVIATSGTLQVAGGTTTVSGSANAIGKTLEIGEEGTLSLSGSYTLDGLAVQDYKVDYVGDEGQTIPTGSGFLKTSGTVQVANILSGGALNIGTGVTFTHNGTAVEVATDTGIGTLTGDVNYNALYVNNGEPVSYAAAQVIAQAQPGSPTVNSVHLTVDGATINMDAAATIGLAIADNAIGTVNATADTSISGITGAPAKLIVTGDSVVTLTSANSITAAVEIDGTATLKMGNAGALGNTSGVTVRTGATLDVNGAKNQDTCISVTLAGGKLANTGNEASYGSKQLVNSLVVANNSIVDAQSNDFGIISGSYAKSTLTLNATLEKIGSHDFHLANTTVTGEGAIKVTEGAVWFGRASTAGIGSYASDFIMNGGGVEGRLALADNITVTTVAGGSTFSANVTNNGYTITFDGAGNLTMSGAISGNGGLIKEGEGTLTLNGTQTYTGDTVVKGGTLDIQGSISDNSKVKVEESANIAGRTENITVGIEAGETATFTNAGGYTPKDSHVTFVTPGIGVVVSNLGETEAEYSIHNAQMKVTADTLVVDSTATGSVQVDNALAVHEITNNGPVALKLTSVTGSALEDVTANAGNIEIDNLEAVQQLRTLSIASGLDVTFLQKPESPEAVVKEATVTIAESVWHDPETGEDYYYGGILYAGGGTLHANLVLSHMSIWDLDGGSMNLGSELTLRDSIQLDADTIRALDSMKVGETHWMVNAVDGTQISYSDADVWYDSKFVRDAYDGGASLEGDFIIVQNNDGTKWGLKKESDTPEPTTGTLSLLALCALAARRRRK